MQLVLFRIEAMDILLSGFAFVVSKSRLLVFKEANLKQQLQGSW